MFIITGFQGTGNRIKKGMKRSAERMERFLRSDRVPVFFPPLFTINRF